MKSTERLVILQFLFQHTRPVFEGVVEDHIRAKNNYKASNVARACRLLRSEGYIRKIEAPNPNGGRAVNTYLITESGRQFVLNGMPPETKSFLEEWGTKQTEPQVTQSAGTLF